MTTRRGLRWSVVLAAVCALSVGGVPGGAQERLGGTSGPTADPVLELARQRELDRLQNRIGRFVSGEAAVYAGTLTAVELRAGREHRRLPECRVIAALEEHERLPGGDGSGVTLTAVGPGPGLWLRVDQARDEPGVTRVTGLRPVRSTAGIAGSCGGCLGDLGARPRVVRFEGFEAAGRLRDVHGTEFRIELSGRLEMVPPAELELADVESLDPGLEKLLQGEDEEFTPVGGEAVLRVERELRQRVPPPPRAPPRTRCDLVTRYSAERFVDLADLRRFGVRDLEVLGVEVCCLDRDAHGEAEHCSEVEPG